MFDLYCISSPEFLDISQNLSNFLFTISDIFPTKKEAKSVIGTQTLTNSDNKTFIGSPETIKERLEPLLNKTQAEELKVVTICEPFSARAESYRLLKELFS